MSNLATANYKTVTAFLNQVKELEDQLLPDQEKGKGSTKTWKAPTDLESFTKLKYELNLTLKDLRTVNKLSHLFNVILNLLMIIHYLSLSL